MSIQSAVTADAPARKHRWGDPVTILPSEAFDGNERTERVCPSCGLVKITVHPPHGLPWREWRHRDAAAPIALTHTPPCLPVEVPA